MTDDLSAAIESILRTDDLSEEIHQAQINTLRGAYEAALAQPEQEPAGQLQEEAFGRGQVMWFNKPADLSMLYTAPPQRRPLTDEQKQTIHNETGAGHSLICLVESYINDIK